MKIRNKKMLAILLLTGCALSVYFSLVFLRPVDIVAVHHRSSGFSDVLVRNFPFSDKSKINWWIANKELLKENYGIPEPDEDGRFWVTFWLFGDGYKEEDKYDRMCFQDMKTKENCIDKNKSMTVIYSKNTGLYFLLHDGEYRLKENGEMVKTKYK